jgi:hypothetical protein
VVNDQNAAVAQVRWFGGCDDRSWAMRKDDEMISIKHTNGYVIMPGEIVLEWVFGRSCCNNG